MMLLVTLLLLLGGLLVGIGSVGLPFHVFILIYSGYLFTLAAAVLAPMAARA